ncbi:DUF1289 domain-containing protein [Jiella mangrovi]|uniref:DUF1289 domain-containing protein n=1 Tax=Jiella mangrovi TaxID=2821407 RepID=A0ABS4BHF3_9HYPH|nr:DUF1289 domain-containing protein [Jiella mangrovi]MBP0616187.1 DUF1289 domain-containing protein [Jiella mangrovi]
MAIESPCTRVCTIDPSTGLCLGCARSLEEIGGWAGFSAATRQRIMAELGQRMTALTETARQKPPAAAGKERRSETVVASDAS